MDVYHGLLIVDKPKGITSREAVNRSQSWFPRHTRIGHAGTLDPLATGVLVICVGAATRLIEYVQRMKKIYQARIQLGARSDTDDAEGTIELVDIPRPPEKPVVTRVLETFQGEIEQVPPIYSAAKVAGRRAYKLARTGQDFCLEKRRVMIHALDLQAYNYPWLDIEVACGKGTYIRSLARDLGDHLGCGAFVETLRRTQVGPFVAANAIPLDLHPAEIPGRLLPLSAAVSELPRIVLQDSEILSLRQGQSLRWPNAGGTGIGSVGGTGVSPVNDRGEAGPPGGTPVPPASAQGTEMAALDCRDTLVAIVGVDAGKELLFPVKVLPKLNRTS
jgi:tRNA pseudouridine55 synthase